MAQVIFRAIDYPVGTRLFDLDGWTIHQGNFVIEAVDRTEADGTTVNRVWSIVSGSNTTVASYSGIGESTQVEAAQVAIKDGSSSNYLGGIGADPTDFYSGQETGDEGRIVRIDGGGFGGTLADEAFGNRVREDRYYYARTNVSTDGSLATITHESWQRGTDASERYDPYPDDWELETQRADLSTTDSQNQYQSAGPPAIRVFSANYDDMAWLSFGTDGDPAPTEPVDDDDGEQFITASQRASFALDTRAPALQAGASVTATRAELALNTIAGTTRAGYSKTGAVSQISLSSAPGTAQAGAAVEAAPLSLQLSARPGTVITGDDVPVVIQAARADLSLSTQSGDVIRGHAIEGGAIAFSIEPRPGTVQTADAVPFVVTGATANLSLSTESGDIEAGALLEGATVMLSLDPDSPDIVRGHVIDGSPALLELLANTGDVFTGLIFATPITRTRAVDISPRYNVSIMTPRYSVRTIN